MAGVARPLWHVLSAMPPMALALVRDGPLAALATGTGAVLIDVDHLVDWALNGGHQDYSQRIVLPLHGWEYPLLILAGTWLSAWAGRRGHITFGRHSSAAARALPGLAGGWACHLLLDWLVNRPEQPTGYSLLRRLRHRFQRAPSGWLTEPAWRLNHRPNWRAAPGEAAAGALLACFLILVGRR